MRSFVAMLLLSLCLPAVAQLRDPLAVEHVDAANFMGEWYEIARLPNRLEHDCARDVTSTFERRTEEAIRVTYRCKTLDGESQQIRGVGRIRDMASQSKLEMRFAPLALAWWPFVWDDWWILELPSASGYMMVGDPSREALWIFARSRQLDDATYGILVAHAARQGYDTQHLVKTPQSQR
ncbi:MAG: lipocalin family protein [Casimicrobiaceae bacterium]